ncbi:acyl-homoserine-lactone synthase [Erwinia sp. P6884]|uniref:acyl-homoserine-lactone synthase n=1 Tax=Erwinia sp. P6884 TaxID=3141450 RepID=UPI00318482E7
MLHLLDINYRSLSEVRGKELFTLRKSVFKDRLNWMVNSEDNMESDEYDNELTTYVFGMFDDVCICSLRFIETRHPNMITGTFKSYFRAFDLPDGNYLEASRLFIDKARVQALKLRRQPISTLLFLSMINYARENNYAGIYAIVSHPMYLIFKRSGWKIEVMEQGLSEKDQNIYLIFMPVDKENQQTLIEALRAKVPRLNGCRLDSWPLAFPVRKNGADEI